MLLLGGTRLKAGHMTTSISHPDLLNLLAGPSVLTIDCRKVLCKGLLPRSRVLRLKGGNLEQALEQLIEEHITL